MASVLQGAVAGRGPVAGEGRRHRGPSDLGRGYTTIHALSFEAEEKKKEKKKYMPYLFEPPFYLLAF